jgi:exportin-2 (importin alpha re-exporter)
MTYIIVTHLTHVSAEQALKAQESTPGFSLALLQIVNTDSFPQATRLAAALFFKNFVRRNWVVRDGQTGAGGED